MLMRVDLHGLVTPVAPPCIVTKTARYLVMRIMLRTMLPKVKAIVLHMVLSRIVLMQSSMNEAMSCDEGYHVSNVIGDLVYFEFEQCV
jgi:small ligand-binding sensory domain FIST